MRILTVGTLLSMTNNPGPGWTIVCCQFCGERMYCLEKNSKANPGDELVLSCAECLNNLEDMDSLYHHNMPDPWSDEWKLN